MTLLSIRLFKVSAMKHFYVTRVLDELVAGLHYCLHVCYKILDVEVLQVSYGMPRST